MSVKILLSIPCALILLIASLAGAAAATQLEPDEPIDLELEQAPLVETLRSFASISGSRLDIAPDIAGSVTLALETTPWRQVLDRICIAHRLNCELLSGEPPVLRVRPTSHATGAAAQAGYAEAIDMSLRGANLRQTLQAFGSVGGIDVIVDDGISGSLTIEVNDTPWTVVLEEACNLSGCRVEWGVSTAHILPADPVMTAQRQAVFAEGEISVVEALRALVKMPIFGAFGEPELALPEGLEGTLRLEPYQANWLEALNAICRAGACQWQLTYGAPSRLVVQPGQKGLKDRVMLPSDATTLEDTATILATRLGLEVALNQDLDPRAAVRFTMPEATWRDAAEELCRQASCFWTIHDGRLVLSPRIKTLSSGPVAGAEDRRLHLRFYPPGATVPIEGTARFNWATPIRTFGSVPTTRHQGTSVDRRWLVRLSWIPFGPEMDLVTPMIIRCGIDGNASELLNPVLWPPEAPITRQWRGAIVELSSTTANNGLAQSPTPRLDCGKRATDTPSRGETGGTIRASFRRAGAKAGSPETRLQLETQPGTYLLVTPPGTEDQPRPAAAVLALGVDTQGRQRIAVIRPAPDGPGFGIDRRTLPKSGEIIERISAPDGHEFDLRLQSD